MFQPHTSATQQPMPKVLLPGSKKQSFADNICLHVQML